MEQHDRYKGLNDDLIAECMQCRVAGGCNNHHPSCGHRRGVKYGLYPKSILYNMNSCLSIELSRQITYGYGHEEQPLFKNGDGIEKMCKKIQKFKEPWMKLAEWGLT